MNVRLSSLTINISMRIRLESSDMRSTYSNDNESNDSCTICYINSI